MRDTRVYRNIVKTVTFKKGKADLWYLLSCGHYSRRIHTPITQKYPCPRCTSEEEKRAAARLGQSMREYLALDKKRKKVPSDETKRNLAERIEIRKKKSPETASDEFDLN